MRLLNCLIELPIGTPYSTAFQNYLIRTALYQQSEHIRLMQPATRFSMAIPSHSLAVSHQFYSETVGCEQVERSDRHTRYRMFNHELLICDMGDSFKPQEHCNHVDKYDVPVPHFGIVLTEPQFHQLSQRLTSIGTKFIIEPHLRFTGQVGQQWTMFFKDPTGNNLEFKAMTNPSYLFAS